jgi:uncharacterized membrane protein
MLAKTRRGALIMAGMAFLSYALTDLLISVGIYYRTTGTLPPLQEEFPNIPQFFGTYAVLIIAVLVVVGVEGLLIYFLFGEAYFGRRGALRWSLFGMTYALISQGYQSFANDWPFVIKTISELIVVVVTYVVALKLVPLPTKQQPMP